MKDLIGLIKYIFLMVFIMTYPIIVFWMFAAMIDESHYDFWILLYYLNYAISNNILFGWTVGLFIFISPLTLPIIYILCPIEFTYKAIKNHWSKYLDFFLNNIFILTIFLIILFKGLMLVQSNPDMVCIFNFETRTSNIVVPCMFITPVYFLVYITAVIYKIKNSKLFKNENCS